MFKLIYNIFNILYIIYILMSIDIDITNVTKTIDNSINKLNEIVDINHKCFEKLKTISILKEKINLLESDQNPDIIIIKKQLNEKEQELLNKLQEIQEIQSTELTIEEILLEITTINNLLNNNIITNFLIQIKNILKDELPDYNLIIEEIIKLKKDIEDLEKTEEYLFETRIYKYIIKLINNYHYICIKIQNKIFKDSIIKIYEINKVIEEKHQIDINLKLLSLNNTIQEKQEKHQYILYYKNYTDFITLLNNFLEYDKQDIDYNKLINKLIKEYNEYDDIRKKQLENNIFNENEANILKNNNFKLIPKMIENINKKINKYSTNINNNSKFENIEYYKLKKEYNMIFDNFNYINNFIKNKIDNKDQHIKKQNIIVELKMEKKDLEKDLIEKVIKYNNKIKLEFESEFKLIYTKLNLKKLNTKLYNELFLIKNSPDLEYKITYTNKIINYFNKECNKENSCDYKNFIELLKKLLNIFIQEQKLKLKNILKEISEHNKKLKDFTSFFKFEFESESKEITFISKFYFNFNNKVRKKINKVNDYLNTNFNYDYENNFHQILIIDDLEQLNKNINILSNLENNIEYFIEKRNYDINFLEDKQNIDKNNFFKIETENIENIKNIQKEQKNILKLIRQIILIIKNIKQNCLNIILKNKFDDIKKIEVNENNYIKPVYDNLLKDIETYFIFQPIDKNITIIKQLEKLFNYCDQKSNKINNVYFEICKIVNEMIEKENEYNKDNIEKIKLYENIMKNSDNIIELKNDIKIHNLDIYLGNYKNFINLNKFKINKELQISNLELNIKKLDYKDLNKINLDVIINEYNKIFEEVTNIYKIEDKSLQDAYISLKSFTNFIFEYNLYLQISDFIEMIEKDKENINFDEIINKYNEISKIVKIECNKDRNIIYEEFPDNNDDLKNIYANFKKIYDKLKIYFPTSKEEIIFNKIKDIIDEISIDFIKSQIFKIYFFKKIDHTDEEKLIENNIEYINNILSKKNENKANIKIIIKYILNIYDNINAIYNDYSCNGSSVLASNMCKTLLNISNKLATIIIEYENENKN